MVGDWLDQIASDLEWAEAAVQAVEDSRRWNARALAVAKVHPGLNQSLERLRRCLTSEQALLTAIAKDTSANQEDPGTSAAAELRAAFAVVLDDLANVLPAF